MSRPVALILGAGPNIGKGVAAAFSAKGYSVALAARRLSDELTPSGELNIKADLSDPAVVPGIFSTVTAKFGPPSVVVYNAALFTPDAPDPVLAFTPAKFSASLAVNTTSAIVALAESIKSFRSLPSTATSASKTFIFTGNALNDKIIPIMFTFGIAKTATAYAIRAAAENETYQKEGMKFYYADERNEQGGPISPPSAEEAGKVYVELSEQKDQGPWNWVFVKGKGRVEF